MHVSWSLGLEGARPQPDAERRSAAVHLVDGGARFGWRPDELGVLALVLLVEDDDPNPYSAGIIDDEDDDDLDFSTNECLVVTDATRHIHALILMQSPLGILHARARHPPPQP